MRTTLIRAFPCPLGRSLNLVLSLLVLLLIALMPPGSALAQEHQAGSERHGESEPAGPLPHIPMPEGIETATGDAAEHGHWHRHHAGFFVGGSTLKSENGFTIGGDYEYRFSKYLGVGVQVEHAYGELKETVFAFPVFFHPGAGLRLAAGPGFERFTGELSSITAEDEGHGAEATHDKNNHFLWRMQILYDFPVGERFTITPNFALDFLSGRQVAVYGVTFGVGF